MFYRNHKNDEMKLVHTQPCAPKDVRSKYLISITHHPCPANRQKINLQFRVKIKT